MLTNREIATLILFGCLLLFGLFKRSIRKSFLDVLRSFFDKHILTIVVIYLIYSSSLIGVAWYLGWWNVGLIKDTLIVVFITGFGMVFNANRIESGEALVKGTAKSAVGLSAFATFYINLSSFSIVVEIIFQVLFAIVAMLSVVAKHQKDMPRYLITFFDFLLILGGLILIIKTSMDFSEIWQSQGAQQVLDPLILSIWFPFMLIPFVYALGFFMQVQLIFSGLSTLGKEKPLRFGVKTALLLGLHFSIKYAKSFSGQWRFDLIEKTTFGGAWGLMRRMRLSVQESEHRDRAKELRLMRYAGVKGADDQGKRLDQREFKETQRVLTDLLFFQMGQHRNRLGHYFEDPLILLSNPQHYGLSTDLNVTAEVAKDKQSWYAWRRTPSGWVFASGGGRDIDITWYYDGPEPPKSFPGKVKDEWATEPGSDASKNWLSRSEMWR